MNEKFFNLKKEKQDRIINAVLKTIALHGYEHASTEDIVREAGISKGLLFHYFESKKGMLEFVYEYSTRYAMLELRSAIREPSADFFEQEKQILEAELQLMQQYPFILLFLEKLALDPDTAAFSFEQPDPVKRYYDELGIKIRHPEKIISAGAGKITEIISYTKLAILRSLLTGGNYDPDGYRSEILSCLETVRALL